ncbi:hypothetical protein X808_17940 [Mannheimia varigena USDA-ARS-USMARC-1296]|uniref:Uncharacterized protein n=1 Tax=Mannheimia varigena USDA-ARS-USMARC-1296 TaxID=1433287 RepID=W0QEK4_9PAST|nr:hypothetical protein X808_17940 [Mannheimia varigena USDA-ARS-USMARC-1296]
MYGSLILINSSFCPPLFAVDRVVFLKSSAWLNRFLLALPYIVSLVPLFACLALLKARSMGKAHYLNTGLKT